MIDDLTHILCTCEVISNCFFAKFYPCFKTSRLTGSRTEISVHLNRATDLKYIHYTYSTEQAQNPGDRMTNIYFLPLQLQLVGPAGSLMDDGK